MPEIKMRRKDYLATLSRCEHPGLMLERGFDTWSTKDKQYNEQKKRFYQQLTEIRPSSLYEKAYQRWLNYLLQHTETCRYWTGKVDGRFYLGLGGANPLESAITLHHAYGVPFIPGSAIKGALHHALLAAYDLDKKKYVLEKNEQSIVDTLFGRKPVDSDKQDSGDAGYVIFNDAWWIPGNQTPLVKEIITVHHQEYYAGKQPATDFDSPNPNPQIAIRGSFLFSVEGEPSWAAYAIELLQRTLKHVGIGAKTASGYGYFSDDLKNRQAIDRLGIKLKLDIAQPKEKTALMAENLTLKDLPEKLGKNRNKTADEIGQSFWETYLELVKNKFSEEIKNWASSENKNESKAYKTIYGEWKPH